MEEAVGENLKNMLLVLSSGGYLVSPDEQPEKEQLWDETWKRINRFQPELFKELFPEEAEKPKKSKDERPKETIVEPEGEAKEMVVGEGKKEEENES
jgi:brefeldin A-resistance guanine nucleotide exchange factor 1